MYNRTPHITPTPPPPRTNERTSERTNENHPSFARERGARGACLFSFRFSSMGVSSKTRGASATGLSTVVRAPRALSRASSSPSSSPRFGRENLPAPLGRVFDVSTPFSSLFLPPRGDADERKKREVKTSKTRRGAHTETKQNARGFVRRTNDRANETGEKRTNERTRTKKKRKRANVREEGEGYIHILKTNKVGRTRCVIAPFFFPFLFSFFAFPVTSHDSSIYIGRIHVKEKKRGRKVIEMSEKVSKSRT